MKTPVPFTWRHALLVAVFSAAALLLFCETGEGGTLPLLLATKASGLLLFALGARLAGRWRGKLGIDDLLED